MNNEQYTEIMKRLDFIEFRQQLLFDDDDLSRLLFEYKITHDQYQQIMDLMQHYREKIEQGESVSSAKYETEIYNIVPEHKGDYHMCEFLALEFRNGHRWEEVFDALYGNSPKYSYLKRDDE